MRRQKEQFSKVISDLATVEEEKFLNFNKLTDRVDTFYARLSIAEYSALWKMFVIIFCMFHGQSAVERGFNTNADMVADNYQSDHSLKALRIVHDHMRSYEVGPRDMKINKELLQPVGKLRRRYQEYLEKQKKQKKQTEKDLKRKIVGEEIQDIQKKRKFLTATIEDLIKDDDSKKRDFQLLERYNDPLSLVKGKEDELKELDKMEEIRSIRKENI